MRRHRRDDARAAFESLSGALAPDDSGIAYARAARAIARDPRLMQRRDALIGEVEQLKKRRLMMPELEYDGLLEKLLIDLALVSRDMRART